MIDAQRLGRTGERSAVGDRLHIAEIVPGQHAAASLACAFASNLCPTETISAEKARGGAAAPRHPTGLPGQEWAPVRSAILRACCTARRASPLWVNKSERLAFVIGRGGERLIGVLQALGILANALGRDLQPHPGMHHAGVFRHGGWWATACSRSYRFMLPAPGFARSGELLIYIRPWEGKATNGVSLSARSHRTARPPWSNSDSTWEDVMPVGRKIALVASLALLSVTGSQAQQPPPQSPNMTFFLTSNGPGKGGDLGGLDGADRHCQTLATAAGAGSKTWRAYLSS